jgi:uncharacterized membrane protein
MEFFLALLLPISFWVFKILGIPFWYAGVFLIPFIFLKKNPYWGKWLSGLALLLGIAALVSKSASFVYLYPVIVNVVLLSVFALSLFGRQTIVEKIARIRDASFTDSEIPYVRKVTWAWVIFFSLNGSIALATILIPDKSYWSIYNGGISYVLMGLMFLGELLIRNRYIKRAKQ